MSELPGMWEDADLTGGETDECAHTPIVCNDPLLCTSECNHEWVEVRRHTTGSRTYIKYICRLCDATDEEAEYE